MAGKTFVEKLFDAPAGSIVFKKPDIVLSHDNTASILKTFDKMGGKNVLNPDQLLVVLDHNAPPTSAALANKYEEIRNFVHSQGVKKFHDIGSGICHQIMAGYAKPGMLIVGSDSHTCTAGAFNAFAAGIDRTETAGLWSQGETWFRVPESLKINLKGKLPKGVYAKDLSLWIIGMIGSSGADYMSIEYHGDGIADFSVADRMTLANLASEMGAKNAVFPNDKVLQEHLGEDYEGIEADNDAHFARVIDIELDQLFPVVAAPHHVDNVKALSSLKGTKIHEALIGTCTNGRIEDLRQAADALRGKKVHPDTQLLVIPASKEIYMQALEEGIVKTIMSAGGNFLGSSCGPCLGTGQGIPADNYNVISTANRNFKGRMGNKNSFVYLASPKAVALAAVNGEITDTRKNPTEDTYPYHVKQSKTVDISEGENRYENQVWNYADVDNLNTDLMFAGSLTYQVSSAEPENILPHLFVDFDPQFHKKVAKGDIVLAGDNFGCGSSREHPAVGLAYAGVKAVIVKSVNRIFYRSSVNQGLPIIVLPKAVEAFEQGKKVDVDLEKGEITVGKQKFNFEPLPGKLMEIFNKKGLVNYIRDKNS
ncbi:MAG: 3-isopropylmalate dehydratase large subunit [Bacteroidales bacterium]|nr:3-isopropylmalate dehydratase large subunit [Bacteroidales bacterium]MCF8327596.1 3-isopropylmalate dehydratase large subunit [Bacteroidales bacterium]